MKKLIYGVCAVLFAFMLALALTACDNGNGGNGGNGGTGGGGTAPTVTTTSLLNGTVNTAYSQTLAAAGDTPITWSVESGSLPTGLTISGSTISGTPTAAGTFNFTVKAANTAGSDSKALSIVIAQGINPGGDGSSIFNAILLTANQWADGSLPTGSSEQWFAFTATSPTYYIHSSGTLDWLIVQVYDSSTAPVGSETNLYSSTPCALQLLTAGQTYYLRVKSYFSSNSGTYQIGFNAVPAVPGTTFIPLTDNKWANGNLPTSSDEQWFRFTATASTQYIYVDFGTLTYFSVYVYNSSGVAVGGETAFMSGINTNSISLTLAMGQTYYIRVRPNIVSGTYKIGFNSLSYAAPN